MILKCYFCHTELPRRGSDYIWECYACGENKGTCGLQVFTTPRGFEEDTPDAPEDPIYAHVYVYRHERQYHFRLHLKEGYTFLGVNPGDKPILNLPGFPITPTNAKEKLTTYLVFL